MSVAVQQQRSAGAKTIQRHYRRHAWNNSFTCELETVTKPGIPWRCHRLTGRTQARAWKLGWSVAHRASSRREWRSVRVTVRLVISRGRRKPTAYVPIRTSGPA